MKIRFIEDTYIRKAPKSKGNLPLGTMHQGAEIEVEPDTVKGTSLNGNNQWYRDKNGWYYWSGRTEAVAPPPPKPPETLGGIMVAPVQPQDIPALQEPGIPVAAPPLANDDATWNTGEIPDGETRLAPPLNVLLEMEKQSGAGLLGSAPTIPAAMPPAGAASLLESARRGALTPPSTESAAVLEQPMPVQQPLSQPAHTPARWQNPAPRQLNWCLQNYRIPQDWWQKRQLTGKNVTIALLSTGAAPQHPDLPNIQSTFLFPDISLSHGDAHGLGTQAAVLAAGAGHTAFGVAPEAQLLIGKIGEHDHLITPDSLLTGLHWAISANADIIAMLVDFPELPPPHQDSLQRLVQEALQRGILLVAPVGTSDNKKPESRYPARLNGVLSVGAHDQYGQRCSFSARSYDLDLLAPGEGLLTAAPDGRAVFNLKSTAIAAAFSAGFLALLRQWQREKQASLSPGELFDLLRQTAVPRRAFNKGEDVEYGHGILNPIEILSRLDQL